MPPLRCDSCVTQAPSPQRLCRLELLVTREGLEPSTQRLRDSRTIACRGVIARTTVTLELSFLYSKLTRRMGAGGEMRKGFFDGEAVRCLRCSNLLGLEPIGFDTPLGPVCLRCIDELARNRRARQPASSTLPAPDGSEGTLTAP